MNIREIKNRGVSPFDGLVVAVLLLAGTAAAHPPDLFPSHYEARERHSDMWLDVPTWDDEADPFKQIDEDVGKFSFGNSYYDNQSNSDEKELI